MQLAADGLAVPVNLAAAPQAIFEIPSTTRDSTVSHTEAAVDIDDDDAVRAILEAVVAASEAAESANGSNSTQFPSNGQSTGLAADANKADVTQIPQQNSPWSFASASFRLHSSTAVTHTTGISAELAAFWAPQRWFCEQVATGITSIGRGLRTLVQLVPSTAGPSSSQAEHEQHPWEAGLVLTWRSVCTSAQSMHERAAAIVEAAGFCQRLKVRAPKKKKKKKTEKRRRP
eukprot:SAG31_NODE_10272_length_1162_cov_1.350894_1_plen_231_part_00